MNTISRHEFEQLKIDVEKNEEYLELINERVGLHIDAVSEVLRRHIPAETREKIKEDMLKGLEEQELIHAIEEIL